MGFCDRAADSDRVPAIRDSKKTPGPMLLAIVAVVASLACAVFGDEKEKTPNQTPNQTHSRDNPVLKSILSPDIKITGRWTGVIRRGYEEHTLAIDMDPNDKDVYRLKFYSWTDTAGVIKAQRKGKLENGVLSFDDPIKGFGISQAPFSVLYAVRAEGKEFLLPAANVDELKTAEDVKPRIAYQFQRRLAR